MNERRFLVPFINLGHLLDHLVMLVFPTVVVALAREWDRPYSELLPLALGGFIAFGAFAIPAGWLADHWSRYKMMAVFFFGIGGSLFLTGFATTSWQIGLGLTLVGMFAAIYHPVGIAMLVAVPEKMGRALGWNGLWGNLGLAAAALVAGALMDLWGWRAAFFIPGLAAIAAGAAFLVADRGPLAMSLNQAGGFARTREGKRNGAAHPDRATRYQSRSTARIHRPLRPSSVHSSPPSSPSWAKIFRFVEWPGFTRAFGFTWWTALLTATWSSILPSPRCSWGACAPAAPAQPQPGPARNRPAATGSGVCAAHRREG